MKYVTFLTLAMVLGLVSACDESASRQQSRSAQYVEIDAQGQRFIVKRIQVVKDDIAYGGERGVYVITDTETGFRYVGVSGVGIVETSAHSITVGKTTTTEADER